MTINVNSGPFDRDEDGDNSRDTVPDTPQDPHDTRDPGDAETSPPDYQ